MVTKEQIDALNELVELGQQIGDYDKPSSALPAGALDHVDDECFGEVMAERNRLLTLATKHCPRDHHDWQEILRIAGDA